jgi:hypothetical protein
MTVLPYDAVLCDIDGVLRHWPTRGHAHLDAVTGGGIPALPIPDSTINASQGGGNPAPAGPPRRADASGSRPRRPASGSRLPAGSLDVLFGTGAR